MAINTASSAKHPLPSNQSLIGFFAFNLLLLCFLSFWLFKQNQPISLPTPSLVSDGKMQCISYSPYYQAGVSPLKIDTFITPKQIDEDLAKLSKHTHCVRIYSVSQGLDYVPEAASKLGMKVYLGAWIGWVKSVNDKELDLAIKLANQYPDTIKALIVGNEVLLRGEQSELALKRYILKAKAETRVAVTYADVWEFWRKHPALEESVDYVTVHILPYWEDHPQPIEQALEHTNAVMNLLDKTFTKPILIGETGWPSTGRTRQESVPSLINQATYIRGFLKLAEEKEWQYNVIEAVDQPWKRNLEGTVGGHWGVFDTEFKAKFLLVGDVQARQDDLKSFLLAWASALLFLGLALFLKERRRVALSAIVTMGFLTGLSSLFQIEYLISACRTTLEWLGLGSLSGISLLTAVSLLWSISKPSQFNTNLLKLCLYILISAAFVTSYLLIVDGRYRDYSLCLFLLPAIQLSFGLLILKQSLRTTFRVVYLFNVILMGTALYCLYLEPSNTTIYIWGFINLMLTFSLWPKKPTQN